MLKIVLAAAMLSITAGGSLAAPQSDWMNGVEMAQTGINSEAGRPDPRERPRPTRYYCVLDNGGTCPASPGRVGGRCRCPNQTGGGQLSAY